ncbi:MAG: mRNA interferase [Frateuria sp.]|nr:mRNA interferase [Frateuria sp.]
MKMTEFRRWLRQVHHARFEEGSRHTKVFCNGRQSTIPRHANEIGEGLRQAILKQLRIK